MLVRARLEGRVKPGKMITARFRPQAFDHGFADPARGETVGSKVIVP